MNNEEKNLHEEFVRFGVAAKEAIHKCALMLPEIARRSIWKKKGCGSIYEYARIFAGMSGHAVDEALRVLKHVEELPALRSIIESKGINAVKPIITIATPETDIFWAEKAETMSKNALEVYVREIKYQQRVQNEAEKFPRKFSEAENHQVQDQEVTINISSELAQKLIKLKGQGEWENLMNELLQYREEALQQKQPEQKITDSRHIPAQIERFIMDRSRGICEFSTCTKPYTILHHTQRFALEKTHDPMRIAALCTAHERLAHLGLIENEDQKPQYWRVREQPNTEDPTYVIDTIVQTYRRPG